MIVIREAKGDDDLMFLWDMLYEAASIDQHMREIGKTACLKIPAIDKYLSHWGRKDDLALIAFDEMSKKRIGAAWYRLFPLENAGYGYVANDIPEISVAVVPENRGTGIGTLLLKSLIEKAKENGYTALSLSVDKKNKARNLYQRLGFIEAHISKTTDKSVTLIIQLRK